MRHAVDPVPALEQLATAAREFADILKKRNVGALANEEDAKVVAGFYRRLAAAQRELNAWAQQLERGL